MSQVRRVVLIAVILFGFVALFIELSTSVLAAPSSADSGPGCSGEFCCGPNGPPASCSTTSGQPTPATQPPRSFVYNEGLKAGKKAGEMDPAGANGKCPKDDPVYCAGWEEGYKEAQKAKEQESGQGQGGGILPTGIFTGVAITSAILAAAAALASSIVAAAGRSGGFTIKGIPLKGILIGGAVIFGVIALGGEAAALYPPLAAAILRLLSGAALA